MWLLSGIFMLILLSGAVVLSAAAALSLKAQDLPEQPASFYPNSRDPFSFLFDE